MKNYRNFWDFLDQTPKNNWSIIVINFLSLTMMFIVLFTGDQFDPEWSRYALAVFLFTIAILAWVRVLLIWKKLK
jgi:hypothetical protein